MQKTKNNSFNRFSSRRKSKPQKSLVRNIFLFTITGEKYSFTEDKRIYMSRKQTIMPGDITAITDISQEKENYSSQS